VVAYRGNSPETPDSTVTCGGAAEKDVGAGMTLHVSREEAYGLLRA
jgi:hypothetical protein